MQTFVEYYKDSGLGKWLDEKWVDISRKDKSGKHPPCGASAKKGSRKDSQKKSYPKCRPAKKAGKMSAKLKKKAVAQKRRAEKKETHSAGRMPIVVSHKNLKESALMNEAKKPSKNKPNNPKLWARAQAWARSKFDVHPSAYSNLAASKWYKQHGGTWRKVKKSTKNESSLISFSKWLEKKNLIID